MSVEHKRIEQPRLPLSLANYSEREVVFSGGVGIGSPAMEVLEQISSRYPRIRRFYYIDYAVGYTEWEWPEVSRDNFKRLPKTLINYDRLRSLSKSLISPASDKYDLLAITSMVLLRGSTFRSRIWAHIPLMDLACKKGDKNLNRVAEVFSPYQGFVLDSGNSYHFWGLHLLSKNEWLEFLDYCSQQRLEDGSPLVDEKYISYSRRRGFSALRLFGHPKKLFEPKVVRILV